jgi:YD repeat-containing protein
MSTTGRPPAPPSSAATAHHNQHHLYTYYEDGRKDRNETDPANKVTTYTYDNAGRLTASRQTQGQCTYGYDDAGNRISITDGRGQTTSFQYDARKRLIKTDYPDELSYTSVKTPTTAPAIWPNYQPIRPASSSTPTTPPTS